MDPTLHLLLATLVFIATHFVTSTPLRAALVGAIGEKPYLGLYTVVSFATLGWMSVAYANAPAGEALWTPLRWLPAWVMPFSFVLLVAGYYRNPTAVMAGGLLRSAEPARGMIRITRHPLMWAIMLWAAVHIAARADVTAIIFYGGLFLTAGLGTLLMDARKARVHGEDWQRFIAVTSHLPFIAILQGRNRFVASEIGWKLPLAGLVAYAAFFAAHGWLFRAQPY